MGQDRPGGSQEDRCDGVDVLPWKKKFGGLRIDQAKRQRALVPCALTGVAFGFGEVRGYLDRSRPVDPAVERHEFEIVSRMAGHAPAKRWLAEAIRRLPAETR